MAIPTRTTPDDEDAGGRHTHPMALPKASVTVLRGKAGI
jgi:hypothetical protein